LTVSRSSRGIGPSSTDWGVQAVAELIRGVAGDQDAVLLCNEGVRKEGEWCHRQIFAAWSQEQTGGGRARAVAPQTTTRTIPGDPAQVDGAQGDLVLVDREDDDVAAQHFAVELRGVLLRHFDVVGLEAALSQRPKLCLESVDD
jgi:hypothetical protein